MATPAGLRVSAVAAVSETQCWAIAGNVVVRTTDGANWIRVDVPTRERLTGISATDGRTIAVTTASGAVLVTTDGGATWRR